jgi:hypothetical protein
MNDGSGKNSYQAYYDGTPFEQSESVPVCSTVSDLYPSIPTQNAAYCVPEVQVTAGTIQEPFVSVKEPDAPVSA